MSLTAEQLAELDLSSRLLIPLFSSPLRPEKITPTLNPTCPQENALPFSIVTKPFGIFQGVGQETKESLPILGIRNEYKRVC